MIPKIIWQTHEYDFEDLPYPYNLNAKTWIDKNPRYKYKYVNAAERRIQIELLRPDLLYIYDTIPGIVFKTDVWRYIVLSEYGGFYADLDSVCIQPLDIYADQEFISMTSGGYWKCPGHMETWEYVETEHVPCNRFTEELISNSHFGSSAKNKILYDLLDTINLNFKTAYPNGVGMNEMGHHHITEPLTFSNTLIKYNDRVSKSIVYYDMEHKKDQSCLDGKSKDKIQICHGDIHKNKYIAVD